jgi:hypothetical protein
MLSLQGEDSRSEYLTTNVKHFLALKTAAIVYNFSTSKRIQFRNAFHICSEDGNGCELRSGCDTVQAYRWFPTFLSCALKTEVIRSSERL